MRDVDQQVQSGAEGTSALKEEKGSASETMATDLHRIVQRRIQSGTEGMDITGEAASGNENTASNPWNTHSGCQRPNVRRAVPQSEENVPSGTRRIVADPRFDR